MDTNKILSADILDILFDDRNKEYGAYDLRKTYSRRVKKALLLTTSLLVVTFTGIVLANTFKPNQTNTLDIKSVTLADVQDKKPEPEPLPEPPPKKEIEPVQTEKLTTIKVVDDKDVVEPPPTKDELDVAKIDVIKQSGTLDDHTVVEPQNLDDGKGIIPEIKTKEPEIFDKVEIEAEFKGDWVKFLTRNINAQVPSDNGAPPGNYKVIIQFVVDVDGSVSDIKPLTDLGFGMEKEAMRVLQKATKWEAAIQNGRKVKAYRKQPITFQVTNEE